MKKITLVIIIIFFNEKVIEKVIVFRLINILSPIVIFKFVCVGISY